MSDDDRILCSCCTAAAKYEVAEHYACGKHLTYVVDMYLKMESDV